MKRIPALLTLLCIALLLFSGCAIPDSLPDIPALFQGGVRLPPAEKEKLPPAEEGLPPAEEDFQMPEVTVLPPEPEESPFDFPYDPEKPTMVLTFDDGPNATLSPLLVEELNARGVKASFFVLGINAERNREVIELQYAGGHDVCSHGYDHQSKLTLLSEEELAYQLEETARVIREITGHEPPYVRPPYGAIDKTTAEKIPGPLMLWTLDPRDWENRDAEQVRENILQNAFDGAVVICHDQYESTLTGVLEAVDILLEQGWQFLSLSQYYQSIGLEPQPGQVYRGSQLADL